MRDCAASLDTATEKNSSENTQSDAREGDVFTRHGHYCFTKALQTFRRVRLAKEKREKARKCSTNL